MNVTKIPLREILDAETYNMVREEIESYVDDHFTEDRYTHSGILEIEVIVEHERIT